MSWSYRNPLAGIAPKVVHRDDVDETVIAQQLEEREGEVALDAYVRAQTSAPEVVKRITELENILQRLAHAVFALSDFENHPELGEIGEEAKLVLKNRLEVDHEAYRVRTDLGPFHDQLGLFKK